MILELLSSSAVGTALGGLFAWLNRVEERKVIAAKNEHERAMIALQAQADLDKSKAMLELAKTQGELAAFGESQKNGMVKTGIKMVDAVIGVMRPALTFLLFVLTCGIIWTLSERVGGVEGLSNTDATEIYRHAVYEVIFLTSTAIAWWFGARGNSVRGKKAA